MPDPTSKRASVITGAAESGIAFDCGEGAIDLAARVALEAVRDAGVELSDIDGLMVAKGGDLVALDRPANELAEHLGLSLSAVDTTLTGGSSALSQVIHAAEVIAAGRCNRILLVYSSTQASSRLRSVGGYKRPSENRPVQLENAAGLLSPIGIIALAATRYMHEYRPDGDVLAEVALASRRWASRNPAALKRDPLTLDMVQSSPVIATPLRKADCCLITDGAGALLIESAEAARGRAGALVAGGAEAHHHYSTFGVESLVSTLAARTGPQAMDMAGVTPADIGLLQIYDAFTILPIIALEDLGFAERGRGGYLVRDGETSPGGSLPMTTNGGGLSHCHPGQYGTFLLVEAVRQLKWQARGRQVDADWTLCHAPGGGSFAGSTATVVLRRV